MSILGTIAGGVFGGLGQQKTFRNNKRLMQMQQKFDKQMYDYQNAYNTPANQMKRLKDAGLNPALMYGQGTTGNAVNQPTAQTIPTTFSGVELAQSAAAGAQLSVMNAQAKSLKADAFAKTLDAYASTGGDKQKAYQAYKYQMDNLLADTDTKLQQALNISEDTQLKMQQRGLTAEKINSEKIIQKLNNANVDLIKVKTELEKINKGQAEKGIFPSMIQTFMNAYGLDFRIAEDRVLAQGVITSLLASQIIRSFR